MVELGEIAPQVEALRALSQVNPFLGERLTWMRAALGPGYEPRSEDAAGQADDPNVPSLYALAELLIGPMMAAYRKQRDQIEAVDRERYAGTVFHVLFARHGAELSVDRLEVAHYPAFERDFHELFSACPPPDPSVETPQHLLACFWQIRRALDTIHGTLTGASRPAARLRAAIWQSIFSHDAGRYRRTLYRAMPDIPTLITGPTGTGKELVARAIGHSGYIPFDTPRQRFSHQPIVLPLNLQALSAALVESELFGHKKGAFTGAIADREGWLAMCPRGGTVFLDEIGELDPMLQVKLLRVLDDRTFSPVGDTSLHRFVGKVVAATHRDLVKAIDDGDFRADLYYRLCGDRIEVPTLRERLDADAEELPRMVTALVGRWVDQGHVAEAVSLVVDAIRQSRGEAWPWPGNIRELAQCARNVLVQGSCGPSALQHGPSRPWLAAAAAGTLTLSELQQAYIQHVHERLGSYKATGDALAIDWRTVKAAVPNTASGLGGPRD